MPYPKSLVKISTIKEKIKAIKEKIKAKGEKIFR